MINLFQDIPEETIETTLDMIQRNLDQIGLYGGHTIRKHTDVMPHLSGIWKLRRQW